jgi:Lipopolysaccharide kinase (Kdo/WaaP) family
MKRFISPDYFDLLTRHGLNTFAGFWDLPRNWVEESNVRRNGWSGAIRHTLVDGEAGSLSMFVKLQENHNYRSLPHMLRWRPTFCRDFSNIRRMERIGVPTVAPVFYAERRDRDKLQAVLATVALDGYRELNSIFEDSSLGTPIRQSILHRIADAVWLIHCHRLQHNGLSGKHIMIKLGEDDAFDICILDLEK